MKFVNLGIVCIFLAQCLVFIPCKGAEASCSCQQITEKLTGMEERLLEAMINQTNDMARIHCPDSWVSFNRSCYLFSKTTATFFGAWVFCKSHGSHLVYVESEQENIFIKTHIRELKDSSYWIGLTDMYLEGIFSWYGTGVPTSFADWFPGEPNNSRGNEHCARYRNIDNDITWNDDNCGRSYRFICEK